MSGSDGGTGRKAPLYPVSELVAGIGRIASPKFDERKTRSLLLPEVQPSPKILVLAKRAIS